MKIKLSIDFDLFAAVEIVHQRTHTSQNNELTVKPFYECLGIEIPITKDQPETYSFIQVQGMNTLKLDYLQYEQNQNQLDKLLLPLNVCVDWHNFSLRGFQIKQMHTASYRQVTFHQNEELLKQIESIILEYLHSIEVCQHEVPKQLCKTLHAINTENPILKMDEEKLIVSAHNLSHQITDTIKDDYTRKDQIILEPYEVVLLSAVKDQIFDESDGVCVTFDQQNCVATLTGRREKVEEAMVKILQSTRKIVSKDVSIMLDGQLRFLKIPEVEAFLHKKFLHEKINATWKIFDETSLKMFAYSEIDLEKADRLFHKSMIDDKVQLEKNQLYCIQTNQWVQLVNSNEKTLEDQVVRVECQDSFVHIFATSTFDTRPLQECICHFLTKNSIKLQTIPLSKPAFKLLRDVFKEEINSVKNDRQKDHIINSIDFKEVEIELTGNESGLNKASREIRNLVSSIYEQEFQLNKKGIAQHIQSPEGKTKISHVERSKGVAFEVNEDQSVEIGSDIPHCQDKPKEISRFQFKSGQTIIIAQGDITELDVEVIVNAANPSLNLEGGLSHIIVKKGSIN